MILLFAILFILVQPVLEAVQNAFKPQWNPVIRKLSLIVRIAIAVTWFFTCTSPKIYYVPTWQLILGYAFVTFMIYDTLWNLTSIICGKDISIWYYGTTKWYDRQMAKLGSWGWFMKFVLGIVGIAFLMGWSI